MEKDHKELEVSVHKLTRRNKELRKENGKLKKDNYILMSENEKLQGQIKGITREYEERLKHIKSKLIELGEEELFAAYLD